MLIEIRVVIDVPEKDESRYPNAIVKTIKEQFPRLKTSYTHSPVIVKIKNMEIKV